MTIRATTETGAYYVIDNEGQFWRKNEGPTQRTWSMKTLPAEPWFNNWHDAYAALSEVDETDTPVVGERLYISSRDEYYLSTVIVAIEECEW